jgi:sRNA-binding carbon storage regulator CsrA
MLRLDLKPGESVTIGDFATITLEEKSGKAARIAFEADRSIPIRKVEAVGMAAASMRLGIRAPKN